MLVGIVVYARAAVGVRHCQRVACVGRHCSTGGADVRVGDVAATQRNMKQGFRQSMAWLHTWTGLLVGWVLLLIFMGDTASYYRDEISRWMRPELPTTTVSTTTALGSAEQYLQTHAADAVRWNITLPDPRTPVVSMYWQNPTRADGKPAGRRQMYGNAIIDPATSRTSPHATRWAANSSTAFRPAPCAGRGRAISWGSARCSCWWRSSAGGDHQQSDHAQENLQGLLYLPPGQGAAVVVGFPQRQRCERIAVQRDDD